jgi:hypothetical protein
MIAPTIHLNGTDGSVLQALVQRQYEAARELLQTMRDGAPNARDYYPQGDAVFEMVAATHRIKVKIIEDLCDDLCKQVLAIRNQRGT